MESSADRIANLINDKILLFKDLVEILKDEKNSIVDIDVDSLWAFSEKKQKIASKIENIRKEILEILTDEKIHHDMELSSFRLSKVLDLIPSETKERLTQANVTIILLKKEVNHLATENKKFIQEYLGVMDELIGTISNVGDPPPVYGKTKYAGKKKRSSYMLNTEV